MKRIVWVGLVLLTGCDALAGRTLAPEERCVVEWVDARAPNAAGDTIVIARVGVCVYPPR